jgi:hypothetical protein
MRRRHEQAREVPLALDQIEPTSRPLGRVLEMSLLNSFAPPKRFVWGIFLPQGWRVLARSEPGAFDGSRPSL